jgi:hypothetical protein
MEQEIRGVSDAILAGQALELMPVARVGSQGA